MNSSKSIPNRDEDLVFLAIFVSGYLAFIDVSRDVSWLEGLKINECLFWVDPTQIHGHVSRTHE